MTNARQTYETLEEYLYDMVDALEEMCRSVGDVREDMDDVVEWAFGQVAFACRGWQATETPENMAKGLFNVRDRAYAKA